MLVRKSRQAGVVPDNREPIQSPVFQTERLYLRGVTATDATAYTDDFVDYEVIRNLAATVPWPYPKGGVKQYLHDELLPMQGHDHWAWSICLASDPLRQIGNITLWRKGTPEHRGFWLARRHWGKGYMTEAVAPVMHYAFDELRFDHLIFSNALGNARSRGIKEKTGARLIGKEPASFVDPTFTEREIWQLTREDWQSHQTSGD